MTATARILVACACVAAAACDGGGAGAGAADADVRRADADPARADADLSQPDADPSRPDAAALPPGRVFDHRHTDVSAIPAACLAHLTSGEFVFHYAHRSHGSQIIVGAESIEQAAPQYAFAASYTSIPSEEGVFKMWDGMRDGNLVTPEQYWASDAGLAEVRAILSANPSIRYSMWAWSFEISEQSEADVQRYLDAIDALEAEFPNVTFIYMTGPAQGEYMAVNRFQRNEQIRAFAADRGKVLYDFGDLDAWSGGDRHTIDVGGTEVPIEHPDWSIDTPGHSEYEYTHTTRASCENKARAFWVMMAVLEGCAD